jgi:penicillin-binding protein 2
MGSKRVRAAAVAVGLTWLLLGARAFQVQGIQGAEYQREIRTRASILAYEPPKRGELLDRTGKVLARSVRAFDLWITPGQLERDPASLERVAALLGIPAEELVEDARRVMARIERLVVREPERHQVRRRKGEMRYPWSTNRRVPFEAALEIELRPEVYTGFSVREGLRREYPFGEAASHLVGYLGRVNGEEHVRLVREGYFVPEILDHVGNEGVEGLVRRGEFENETIGRAGAERLFDRELRGRGGLVVRQRNLETGSRSVMILTPTEGGQDVSITLDIGFQIQVERILDADSHPHVAALVADVESGDVLAMATKPRYDPNAFVAPVDSEKIRVYFQDEDRKPMLNRAIAGQYQLGSIFKIVTAWSGMREGKVDASATIDCRGRMFDRDDAFRCWLYRQSGTGHGPIAMSAALERSCNCYFYELGRRVGLPALEEAARHLGLGRRSGLGLVGEAAGQLPSDHRPRRWTTMDTMSLAIGQSSMLVTPVQVLRMMVLVANGGEGPAIGLRLGENRPVEAFGLERRQWDAIRKGLRDVVHGPGGTAQHPELRQCGAAGKTGSAQTAPGRPAHAWFAGYAPADRPRFAIVVLVEHGLSGGEAAAPIAGRILKALLKP